MQQDAATIGETVAGEGEHHARHGLFDQRSALLEQELFDNLAKLGAGCSKGITGSGWVWPTVCEEIADVVKGCRNGLLLLQGQSRNSSLKDRGEERRGNKFGGIIKKGVDEQAVKVLNDIWEIDRLNIAHSAENICRLRLEEDIDVVSNAIFDVFSVL